MSEPARTFLFENLPHRLDPDPAVRAADLRDGILTIVAEETGDRRVIRAAAINVALPAAVPTPAPERRYHLRELVERALALGFSDAEVIEILEIARTHCLLRVPQSEAGAEA